jgi:hypothetical protein
MLLPLTLAGTLYFNYIFGNIIVLEGVPFPCLPGVPFHIAESVTDQNDFEQIFDN